MENIGTCAVCTPQGPGDEGNSCLNLNLVVSALCYEMHQKQGWGLGSIR